MAQVVNQEMLDNMAHYYRKRYEPAHAFADAVGMLQMFPGVVGVWPMSAGYGGIAADVSGNNRQLTGAGGIKYSAATDGLYPYCDYEGTTSYHFRADETPLDITGTETWINASQRGLTMGCWAWTDVVGGGGGTGIIGKDQTAGQRSYGVVFGAGDTEYLGRVSVDGTVLTSVAGSGDIGTGTWAFMCLRYTPSTELKMWTNASTNANATSIPASLFNGSSQFEIGRYQASNYLNGRISLAFLCAAAVPDHFIETFYDFTRPMFGV